MATEQQGRELVEELQRMPARVQAAEQAASAAASQAVAAQRQQVALAGGHATRLVDTRALGRPREFKSVREDWKDWSFQFKAFLCGANSDAGAALDAAGIQDQETVSGVAMTKLQNVESHNGLEAWGQLVLEFEPRTAGRRRLHLTVTNLLRPAKTNDMEKLGQTMEQWEREVRDYEK
eukprot:5813338-Amphidinium_carterae.1